MKNPKLLAIIALTFVAGTITSSSVSFAAVSQCSNKSLGSQNSVWVAICDLQDQINHIQLTPGPPGAQGPPGPVGQTGPQGARGTPGLGITKIVHLEPGTCGQPQDKGGISVLVGWCPDGANNEIFFIADNKVTANSVISVTTSNPPVTIGPNCYVIQLFSAEGFDLRCSEHGTNTIFVPVGTKLNYVIINPPPSVSNGVGITITQGAGASQTADCVVANNCFNPNPLTVAPGTQVTWKNTDTVSHTVTSGKPSDNQTGTIFDSGGLIKPGGTFQFTFQNVGTYDYFCIVHPWMIGSVVVGSGGSIAS